MLNIKKLFEKIYAHLMLAGLITIAFIPRIWKAVITMMFIVTVSVVNFGNSS